MQNEQMLRLAERLEPDLAETCRLIEYDMAHRPYGDGDCFVAERAEVARIIAALRSRTGDLSNG